MQIRRNLVTGLIGLAMIAAPITAAAKDNDSGRNSAHQAQAQSRANESRPAMHNEAREQHNDRAEARNPAPQMNRHEGGQERNARVETRQVAPAVAPRNETRENGHNYWVPPLKDEHRDVRADRDRDHDGNRNGRDYRNYGDRDRNYSYRDYDHDDYDHDRDYAAGGWIMPRGYYGGACGWANHLRNVYRHDEYTGHPAAAADLLGQLHRAERACHGVPYGYNNYRYLY